MAVLTLTLNNVSCFEQQITTNPSLPWSNTLGESNSISYNGATKSVSISSEKKGDTLYLNCKDDDINRDIHGYTFDMVEYKFQKKMYQPTEILAHIQINMASEKTWTLIGRKRIESTFKHKQVKLEVDGDSIGDDFYVHAVLPSYKSDSMIVELKIYSLDKLLTLDKSCNSYVAKKLGSDILMTMLDDYKKPYKSNEALTYNDQMQVLKYDRDSKKAIEHIFPYLVQYNESFYDMLIRTCNRWGEFVYWESDKNGGKLNIGYNSAKTVEKKNENNEKYYVYKTIPGNYKTLTFPNNDTTSELVTDNSQYYFPVGADDSTIRDTNAKKSKWYPKCKIFAFGNMEDVYAMQKFSQFFGTDKDLASFLFSTLIDDLVDLAKEESAVDDKNNNYNGKYFPESDKKTETTDERYNSSYTALNEFTENGTDYNDAKYKEILRYELKAMENVMEIDYDTTWPGLKLGEIIVEEKNNETFIVVEVDCEKNSKGSPVFRIKAIGSSDGTGNKFYPAMLPTGHVRYSGPQKATVQEASSDDPCDQNRVKVVYPWQMDSETGKIIGDLSPRIRIASSDGGANMASRFYKGDWVLIGYIDGNIERPYVLGSIPKIGTVMNNVHTMSTPAGHALNLTDGAGEGFLKFLTNCFTPLYNSISGWAPSSISGWVGKLLDSWDGDKYFEGGFSLTDKYGIYSISGSTDGRNVSIRSPWGDVMINAFTGINIMAPNGDVNIVGKNVKIAAGNNLTLTSGTNIMNLVKNKDGNNQYVYWDKDKIITAVAEKLAKKNLQIVDVKMLRSVVEIIMRPVEGTLTLKSLRFMKLEAGTRNRCGFPEDAYMSKAEMQNKKVTESAMDLVNFNAIKRIFKGLPSFTGKLVLDYKRRHTRLVEEKKRFVLAIAELSQAGIANKAKQGEGVCKTYTELINDFWADGDYEPWEEDKLAFTDRVKVVLLDRETMLYDQKNLDERFYNGMNVFQRKVRVYDICAERVRLRELILQHANNLRKLICEFKQFDVTEKLVKAHFRHNALVSDEFITKLTNSSNKDGCPNAYIYVAPTNDIKKLDSKHFVADLDNKKKYMKRLITYNMLVQLGFSSANRTRGVSDPDVTSTEADGDNSLVNDHYWHTFIDSIRGVSVKKTDQTLPEKLKGTLSKSTGISDFKTMIRDWRDHNIWGKGEDGRILVATDNDTYQIKNNSFELVHKVAPTCISFDNFTDEDKIFDGDKEELNKFLNELKGELNKV